MGAKDVSAKWPKVSKALNKRTRMSYGQMLAKMAKIHSREALDDQMDAAVFSVLVEMIKRGKI
jgi:hypothetical protein